MDSIIGNIQYKERQLADMRLSLQDYQNDLINKKAVIALQEQRLKEVREENKKLKEEQKQLYEINGYLTNNHRIFHQNIFLLKLPHSMFRSSILLNPNHVILNIYHPYT